MKKYLLFLCSLLGIWTVINAQTNISLLGQLSFPGISFAGCWHYVDSSGNEYAIVGASDGVRIIDISNPSSPVQVISVPGESSIWREVKTYGNYAYVSTEASTGIAGVTNGLQIIDLSGLPGSVSYKFYSDSISGSLLMRAHTVTVSDNGYLYVNGTHLANLNVGGVMIFSLADPWNPQYVGNYSVNYVHDCIVYNDTMISSELSNGFAIVDVSNKANPVILQTQATLSNFNHNSWRSDNGQVLFTTDEISGARLASYDISDIFNIKLLDTYLTQTTPSGEVHNVRVLNDFLICPSYQNKLTIVDAAHPANLIEVGSYPTSGNLCWDADPYFPSGNLIACDMGGNFYVLGVNYIRGCYLEGIVSDSVTGLPLANATVGVTAAGLLDTTNLSGEYMTGTVNAGTYTVTVSLPGFITQTITNVQLTNGIVTTLNVQLVHVGTGISEPSEFTHVVVTPNPLTVKGEIIIPRGNEVSQINIYDPLGKFKQVVLKNSNGKFLLDRNNFTSGIYFFEVINQNNLKSRGKFIVE